MYRVPELKIEIKRGMEADEIHCLLAKAFEFPDYYGKNWDAFEDCINDDVSSNPPVSLIIHGWDNFVREHLADAKIFWSCVENRRHTKKPMKVLVTPRACPCCGYLTLSYWHSGSWEVCILCNWEDDAVQFINPEFAGGANKESLNQARERFSKFRQKDLRYIKDFRGPIYT